MRVSSCVASTFVVSSALGEATLPTLIALAYTAFHESFPRIILAASVAQVGAFVACRMAARAMGAAATTKGSREVQLEVTPCHERSV